MEVRTRMAPSPTGEYHIGHIRTLLYNYVYARSMGGKFILRIEDTDQNRYITGAEDKIMVVIKDFGFSWDEGPGVGGPHEPYVQSERLDIYLEKAKELIKKGKAYYCFCSKERLGKLREDQRNKGLPTTKYDKSCLELPDDKIDKLISERVPHVIRLNIPKDRTISFKDGVCGEISVNSNDLDDQVLLKSDGYPTYHLAVVVDDHLMDITHIMRGVDWLPSTPKHVLLYEAFGWELPTYLHLPNLKELGSNKKLSKRFGSVFAADFLKEGYLPEAIVNFLMFLGWNPGTEKEMYTLEDFVKDFSVDRLQKTDLVSFDRDKLLWFNGQYIRNMSEEELWVQLNQWANKYDVNLNGLSHEDVYVKKVLALVRDRMKVLADFNDFTEYFFGDYKVSKEQLVKYAKNEDRAKDILLSFVQVLDDLETSDWTYEQLENICKDLLSEKGFKPKEAYMTLRVALTGREASPHIFDVMEVLGKTETLERVNKSLTHFN